MSTTVKTRPTIPLLAVTFTVLGGGLLLVSPLAALAQDREQNASDGESISQVLDAGPTRRAIRERPVLFEAPDFQPPDGSPVLKVSWDFGDGDEGAGPTVSHVYSQPGSYLVTLTAVSDNNVYSDTAEVHVFNHLLVVVADSSASLEQVKFSARQAASKGVLLHLVQPKGSGPEVLTEEELAGQLRDIRSKLSDAHLVVVWTSGSVGANSLTKFAQHIKPTATPPAKHKPFQGKGIVFLSKTPFGVLAPAAQSTFDQLKPEFTLLTRPAALELLAVTTTAEQARRAVMDSSLEFRLLGNFSARTVSDLSVTNFMSFGINFLINRGVSVSSIALILMLPVIATILAFARQVVGIKAFGLITPAMTTLSFLVMGLRYGLVVFAAILLTGTATRLLLRRLRLLYLPRMALILTSVSFALLLLVGLGAATDRSGVLSFSIFPALILTILAEHFIAAQFKSGLRSAFTVTVWTLALATICYFIVSSELFRTLIVSYPEITLLAIPINLILGQWSGLRLTEYIRFRHLLRHG